MLGRGVQLESRSLDGEPLSGEEIDQLIGARDYKEFLNARNEMYREKNMKQKPPSRAEAIKLMAKNPNLIRRPIVLRGGEMVLGFDETAYEKLLT